LVRQTADAAPQPCHSVEFTEASYGETLGDVAMRHSVDDYHSLLARAISALGSDTAESREELYERARTALVTEFEKLDPPASEADLWQEQLKLDFAIQNLSIVPEMTYAKSA
jgi:hypothetical protein